MDIYTQARVGHNMKYLRNIFGYTQEQIADKLHICRSTYAAFETGRKLPSTDVIVDLAHIYGVRLDTLLQADQTKFVHDVHFADECQLQASKLVDIFYKLSPYSQGCLFERAEMLLDDDRLCSVSHLKTSSGQLI